MGDAQEWSLFPLAEVLDFREGPGILARDFRPNGIPLLRLSGLKDGQNLLSGCNYLDPAMVSRRWRQFQVAEGDVLLSTSASLGEVAVVDEGAVGAVPYTGIISFRPRDRRVLGGFVRYLLQAPMFRTQIEMMGVGSVMRHFGPMHLKRMRLAVPASRVQQAITTLLAGLDEKVALNRKVSGSTEGLARAVFASWFGVLDPDNAPDGWTVASLFDHIDVTRGLSYSSAGLTDDAVPLHNLDSVYEGGGYKYEGIKHYRGEYKNRHVVHGGDLLVVNTEQGFDYLLIGFPALVPERFGESSLYSADLFRVRPLAGSHLTRRFLYLALMSPRLRQLILGYSNGTTVNHLASDGLRRPRLAVPPNEHVQRFDQTVQPLFAKQEQLQIENETLFKLRNLLLPKLMSGDIRLKEAEKAVAEAG